MGDIVRVVFVIVVLAFLVELWRKGSPHAVFACSISGACIIFFLSIGLSLFGDGEFAFQRAYLFSVITYFVVFALLQQTSAELLRRRGLDVTQFWDRTTVFCGLFVGAALWPLLPLALSFFVYPALMKRASEKTNAKRLSHPPA